MDVVDILLKLPKQCLAVSPSDPLLSIILARGVSGYYPYRRFDYPDEASTFVTKFNDRKCVSKAQQEAMLAGSLFGWEVPAANPDSSSTNGELLPAPKGWDKVEGGAQANWGEGEV